MTANLEEMLEGSRRIKIDRLQCMMLEESDTNGRRNNWDTGVDGVGIYLEQCEVSGITRNTVDTHPLIARDYAVC